MSPHCRGCRDDRAQRTGEAEYPFTPLYGDFLVRHEALLAGHPRLALQTKNFAHPDAPGRHAVQARAAAIRRGEVGSLETPAHV